jgi:hypothetical protein
MLSIIYSPQIQLIIAIINKNIELNKTPASKKTYGKKIGPVPSYTFIHKFNPVNAEIVLSFEGFSTIVCESLFPLLVDFIRLSYSYFCIFDILNVNKLFYFI